MREPAAEPRIFHVNRYFPTQLEELRKFPINWGVKEELLTGRAVKPGDVTGAWQGLFRFCCKILTPISAPCVLFSNRVWKHQKSGDRSYVNTNNKLYRDRNVKCGMITEFRDCWGWKRVPRSFPWSPTWDWSPPGQPDQWPGLPWTPPGSPFQGLTTLSRTNKMKFQLQTGVASSHSSNRIKSRISEILNLKSQVLNLESPISNVRSQISNFKSQISSSDLDLEPTPTLAQSGVWCHQCLCEVFVCDNHPKISTTSKTLLDVAGDW